MNGPNRRKEETDLVTATVDEDTHTAVTVVESVAEASDEPVRELPPLHDEVDTDALDRIFENRSTNGRVTIRYFGYLVDIHADGSVTVRETA